MSFPSINTFSFSFPIAFGNSFHVAKLSIVISKVLELGISIPFFEWKHTPKQRCRKTYTNSCKLDHLHRNVLNWLCLAFTVLRPSADSGDGLDTLSEKCITIPVYIRSATCSRKWKKAGLFEPYIRGGYWIARKRRRCEGEAEEVDAPMSRIRWKGLRGGLMGCYLWRLVSKYYLSGHGLSPWMTVDRLNQDRRRLPPCE